MRMVFHSYFSPEIMDSLNIELFNLQDWQEIVKLYEKEGVYLGKKITQLFVVLCQCKLT